MASLYSFSISATSTIPGSEGANTYWQAFDGVPPHIQDPETCASACELCARFRLTEIMLPHTLPLALPVPKLENGMLTALPTIEHDEEEKKDDNTQTVITRRYPLRTRKPTYKVRESFGVQTPKRRVGARPAPQLRPDQPHQQQQRSTIKLRKNRRTIRISLRGEEIRRVEQEYLTLDPEWQEERRKGFAERGVSLQSIEIGR